MRERPLSLCLHPPGPVLNFALEKNKFTHKKDICTQDIIITGTDKWYQHQLNLQVFYDCQRKETTSQGDALTRCLKTTFIIFFLLFHSKPSLAYNPCPKDFTRFCRRNTWCLTHSAGISADVVGANGKDHRRRLKKDSIVGEDEGESVAPKAAVAFPTTYTDLAFHLSFTELFHSENNQESYLII